jgi:AAA15 family ATPase/GTPase
MIIAKELKIKETEFKNLGDINIFIGENNTGKTSLLKKLSKRAKRKGKINTYGLEEITTSKVLNKLFAEEIIDTEHLFPLLNSYFDAPIYDMFFHKIILSQKGLITVNFLGKGLKQLIKLLYILNIRDSRIIFLDNPEIYLSYNSKILLAKEIIRATKRHQIFLTTHSDLLIKELINSANANIKIRMFELKRENENIKCRDLNEKEIFFV